MRRFFLLALALCAVVAVNAASRNDKDRDAKIEAVMADAKAKFQQGNNDVFLPDDNTAWRNGISECQADTYYDKKDEPVGKAFYTDYIFREELQNLSRYYQVTLVNGKPVVVNHPEVTAQHLVAGKWDMIVFRNPNGAVLDVILKQNSRNDEETINDLRDMINGVYVGTNTNASDTVIFGAVYSGDRSLLPGSEYQLEYRGFKDGFPEVFDKLVVAYCPERMKRVHMPEPTKTLDKNGVEHYYGDGKEISRDEYEFLLSRPCGYGGHGSLHGPLLWKVMPQGSNLAVELAAPFDEQLDAFYSNFRDEKFALKWVRSPYKGMKDRWAVLSMRPVTRGMLKIFDKEAQRSMLNYLNAIKNPTDIEALNKSLVNSVFKNVAITKKSYSSNKSKKSKKSRR